MVAVERQSDAITVRFAPAALATLQAFVNAEKQCCTDIGWTVSEAPDLALRIEARPAQLDAFVTMIQTVNIENAR